MVPFSRIILCFCLTALSFQGLGQVSFESTEELEKAANDFFEAENYSGAKPLFSQLLSKDALNPDYNYRFGVCILFTEADPLKPLPYIEGGASMDAVNNEAHYYLGKAYQFNYRFDDAVKSYQKAKSKGYSNSKVDLDKSIAECLSGKVLYNSAIDFKPAQNKQVFAAEFYRPYDFRKLKGKVIPMPPNFKTKFDEKNLQGTVVYTPSNGTTLVFASYGEDGQNGKDLYQVNKLPNGEWAIPQRLPDVINTKYDEDYAFYDTDSKKLLFASKGHNTIGGYDVFSSDYNAETKKWSNPINLQYPVNSPFDDFLYVTDPNGKVAFFTTARNTPEGKLRVMKTLLHDPKLVELSVVEGLFQDLTDSVYNYMSVTVLDPISNQVVGKYRSNTKTGKYVLILPPQNDYTMDIGPREAEGFKFELDVPKNDQVEPLRQDVVYDASSDKGTVTLTNYFDAVGKPDSTALTESRPLKEVEAKMVAMPESEAVLASSKEREAPDNSGQVRAEALAEQEALAKAKAKKDSLDNVKALALKEAIEKEKQLALKAWEDSIAEVQLALEIEAEAQAEVDKKLLAKAEKERLKAEQDSLENLRILALEKAAEQEKQQLAKAKQDSLAELQLALEIEAEALKAQNLAERAKQAELVAIETEKRAEIAKQDSLAELQLALENEAKAIEEHNLAERAKEEALRTKEKARKDSLKAADLRVQLELAKAKKKEQDLVKEREQEDLRLAAVQAAKADSLAEVEMAELELVKRQKAIEDSTLQASQQLAIAEKNRLDAIDREVELAKEKALRDTAEKIVAKQNEMASLDDESFDNLLEEMAAKEAELLEEQEIAANNAKANSNVETAESITTKDSEVIAVAQMETNEPKKKIEESIRTDEGLSESELFLQTIAKLEAQKADQVALIADENAQIAAEKEERAEKARKLALLQEESTENVQQSDSIVKENGQIAEYTADENINVEVEVVALHSDAEPEEYLAALNEAEAQIAEEAASRPDKDYSLKPLDGSSKPAPVTEVVDPVLQQTIDADRLALEQHQKVAKEKETALQEQMQKDKGLLNNYDEKLEMELAAIEDEVDLLKSELETTTSEAVEETIAENVSTEIEAEKLHEVSNEEVVAIMDEEIALAEVTQPDVTEVVEEQPAVAVETEEVEEEPITEPEIALVEEAMEELTEEVIETEESVVEPIVVTVPEEKADAPVIDEEKNESAEENVLELAEENAINEILEEAEKESAEAITESETSVDAELNDEPAIQKPAQREITVGTIPFLEATIRNPERSKPSFDKITDKGVRRMVKRMRSEDVGRLAVLKNIRNTKIDANGDAETIKNIQNNLRNQEVLASSNYNSREEYIRPAFNKDHLKERQNVYYKLEFVVKTSSVSETILESMSPENEMVFAMPEFDLTSEFYSTFADANSGIREYLGRGFKAVSITPYLNGEPATLSVVEQIPFVD